MAAETEPLEHVFTVIERQTLRGRMPMIIRYFFVGADYNQAALKVTRQFD
jgi:hypothetical protein